MFVAYNLHLEFNNFQIENDKCTVVGWTKFGKFVPDKYRIKKFNTLVMKIQEAQGEVIMHQVFPHRKPMFVIEKRTLPEVIAELKAQGWTKEQIARIKPISDITHASKLIGKQLPKQIIAEAAEEEDIEGNLGDGEPSLQFPSILSEVVASSEFTSEDEDTLPELPTEESNEL